MAQDGICSQTMGPLEIEVKFHIPNLSALKKNIIKRGAMSCGKSFETNLRFEDSRESFKKKQCLLRLRKDTKTRLTFKSAPTQNDSQFKIRREMEVVVNDFDGMKEILTAVGFRIQQIYEKWRETFRWKDTILCIDTMPFGNFLEIEGSKDGILEAAAMLNLDWENRILTNYLHMFSIIKQNLGLSFNDLTFDNFSNIQIDIISFLPFFQPSGGAEILRKPA